MVLLRLINGWRPLSFTSDNTPDRQTRQRTAFTVQTVHHLTPSLVQPPGHKGQGAGGLPCPDGAAGPAVTYSYLLVTTSQKPTPGKPLFYQQNHPITFFAGITTFRWSNHHFSVVQSPLFGGSIITFRWSNHHFSVVSPSRISTPVMVFPSLVSEYPAM